MDFSDVLDERDAAVFAAAGYRARAGFGRRPAIAVIDVNHNFCGDRPEPILESIKRWRNSCGEAAWEAIPRINELVAAARQSGVPVIWTTGQTPRPDGLDSGRWADKNTRRAEDGGPRADLVNRMVPELDLQPHDILLSKPKPSIFFATQLTSLLVELEVDSLIVCGTTTSGCVRASVLDGFSLNYRMSVVAECTFDRGVLSHRVNLFDMDCKYADVVHLNEAVEFLGTLPAGLYPRFSGEAVHG